LFVWDGDVIVQEIDADKTVTYVYEPDSFVPLARIESNDGVATYSSQDTHLPEIEDWQPISHRQELDAHVSARKVRNERALALEHLQAREQRLMDAEIGAAQDYCLHYQCDHIGTPIRLLGEHGTVAWDARYKAWGEVLKRGVTKVSQHLRFQGQYADEETGLHYNRFRYYDPQVGRFLTQDPIQISGGENPYQYAPNPTDWTDPLGLKRISSKRKQGPANPSNGTPAKTCPHSSVVNVLKDYPGKRFYFGSNVYLLDKSTMAHILKRHHPQYWDGSQKPTQTYLCADDSIRDIEDSITSVLQDNADRLRQKNGGIGKYQLNGKNGRTVGLNSGRIGQYY
jgi:RHS repeat-associated protein